MWTLWEKTVRVIIVVSIFLFTLKSFAKCEYDNLTDKSRKEDRDLVYENTNNPGTRVAWDGMKEMNKIYYSGTVDDVVKSFEDRICEQFDSEEFKKKYPDAEIKINKMDFKGYYATCSTPEGKPNACKGFDFEKEFAKVEPPKFPVTDEVLESKTFKFTSSNAANYQEGYIRARIKAAYPDYDGKSPPLSEFIKNTLDEAILEATGADSLVDVDMNDKDFKKKLADNLAHSRAGDEAKMDKRFAKIADALDVLMEVPYQGSNNFEKELIEALEPTTNNPPDRFSVVSAKSGDDMNLVVRKGNDIIKVVGVDAKGLGVLNMTSRLEEYLHFVQGGGKVSSMDEVLSIAGKAIDSADEIMDKSMEMYQNNLHDVLELSGSQKLDFDQQLRLAHDFYNSYQETDPHGIMQMRAGALEDSCGRDIKCLQNKITIVHNTLKEMEKKGIEGHFADSCIGVEYWSRKYKVKDVLNIDKK